MKRNLTTKVFPLSVDRDKNGVLRIGDLGVPDLADEWGTPLYIYDEKTVKSNIDLLFQILQSAYQGEYHVSYAAKAFFPLKFAQKVKAFGLSLDAVSMGEMSIAREAGFSPERVHLHGNSKTLSELEYAVDWGVDNIVVDSMEELHTVASLAESKNKTIRIWLRITPGIEVNTHPHIKTAHQHSKFGLPISNGDAGKAIQYAKENRWLHLTGLHTHIGSQIFDAEPYSKAMQMLLDLAESEDYIPEEISPGGGWGVPYLPDQEPADVESMLLGIINVLKDHCTKYSWPLPKLIVETGRWLIARAGIAVYEVGTSKTTSDGTNVVAVNGGMSDNPRYALYQAKYHAEPVKKSDENKNKKTMLVGKFCESGDKLIEEILLPELHRGDLIVIPVSGAYQLSMASSYNYADKPCVLWIENQQVECLQKRELAYKNSWLRGE